MLLTPFGVHRSERVKEAVEQELDRLEEAGQGGPVTGLLP